MGGGGGGATAADGGGGGGPGMLGGTKVLGCQRLAGRAERGEDVLRSMCVGGTC